MDGENSSKVGLPLEQQGEETLQSTENSKTKEEIGWLEEETDQSKPVENTSSIPGKGEDSKTISSSPSKTLAGVPSASGDLHCSYGTCLLCLLFFFSKKSCLYFLDYFIFLNKKKVRYFWGLIFFG